MPIEDEEELPIDIRDALKAATSESYERAFDWGISGSFEFRVGELK